MTKLADFLPKRPPPRLHGVLIRVSVDEHKRLKKAADRAGLKLSTWLRALGLQAAER
jgi:hypothetical protein